MSREVTAISGDKGRVLDRTFPLSFLFHELDRGGAPSGDSLAGCARIPQGRSAGPA